MTTQTVQIHTFDYGASLSSATLRSIADDTLVATADSVNEVTADSGLYAAVFGKASAITAGDYRLRAVIGGQPINRYVTLAGTDNEVVQARSERHAVLDTDALLLAMVTDDTGETEAADGSVAKLAQGAGGAGGTDWTSEQRTYILAQLALLSLSGSAVVVTSGTFMCARGDVEQVYGNRNVEKWADLNNTADADEILSRINYHIAMADNYIRAAISNGAWVMPESGDTIPAILAYNCARLAGVLMYEARGVSDYDSNGRPIHQLMYHKKSVDDFLKSVLNGSISLAPLTYGITNAAPEAT